MHSISINILWQKRIRQQMLEAQPLDYMNLTHLIYNYKILQVIEYVFYGILLKSYQKKTLSIKNPSVEEQYRLVETFSLDSQNFTPYLFLCLSQIHYITCKNGREYIIPLVDCLTLQRKSHKVLKLHRDNWIGEQ